MAKLETDPILQEMLKAAGNSLEDKWPSLRELATFSFRFLARNITDIEKMKEQNKITEEHARLLLDMQKNAVKMTLLTEKGLGLLAVEAAMNAAIGAIEKTVNTALGWKIL
jgi:hypothetical protein